MADAERAENFEKSFEKLSNQADINNAQSDDLRSFMDAGTDEDFFMNRPTGFGTKTRQDIIDQVRINIKARLKQENLKSYKDACIKLEEHDKFNDKFLKTVNDYKKYVQKYNERNAEIVDVDQKIQATTNPVKKAAFKVKRKHLQSGIGGLEGLANDKARKRQILIDNATKWNTALEKYRNDVYKVHYQNYDALALTWFELTRQFERDPNTLPPPVAAPAVPNPAGPNPGPAGGPPAGGVPAGGVPAGGVPAGGPPPGGPAAIPAAGPNPQIDNRALNDAAAEKDISEYTGQFDLNTLTAANETQLSSYDKTNLPIRSRKAPGADSANTEANFIKRHKRILMLGQADQAGIKTRFKLDSRFIGQKAKRQFDPQSLDLPVPVVNPAPDYFDLKYAESMNLEADEKDVYGRYLFSEKTANIEETKVSKTGEKVHGFYLNGEFVTDEHAAPGEDVADKKGMSYSSRPNWDKLEKAEKLRVAIRQSPFFKHVNSRTIQFYASYQTDDDKLSQVLDARAKAMAGYQGQLLTDANKSTLLNSVVENNLKGKMICQYIINAVNHRPPAAGGQPAPAFDPMSDPVIKYANTNHSEGLYNACIFLLTQNSPNLWDTARTITLSCKAAKARTKYKLNRHFPKAGNLMRMALLEELAITGPFKARLDPDDLEGSFFDFTHREAYLEELNNRRGGVGLWFKKNILNGKLRRTLTTAGGELTSGVTDFVHAGAVVSDYKDKYDVNHDSKLSDSEKKEKLETINNTIEKKDEKYNDISREEELWTSYSETVSSFTRLPSTISAGVSTGLAIFTGDTSARDVFSDLSILTSMFSVVWSFVERVKKVHRHIHRSQQEKDSSLEDLDHNTAKDILICMDNILLFLQLICGGINNHVSEVEGRGLLEVKMPEFNKIVIMINSGIDIVRRIIAIIKESFTIHAATTRIGRIDAESGNLTTALNAFKDSTGHTGTQQQRNLGKAASENSQNQFFLALTRINSRKERSQAVGDIVSNVFTMVKDAGSFSDDPVSLSLRGAGTILAKTTDFVTWCVGKLKYDRETFNTSIGTMLGDKEYAGTPYFDKVLKRETGIVNKDYLVDLARIFMSIDTHSMINNPNASDGEKDLAASVVGTLYGNVRDSGGARKDDVIKTIKLKDMLAYTGFDEGSDWRAVLRNSLMKDG